MRTLCLAFLLALLPALAPAQDSTRAVQPDVQPKDPGVATALNVLILGGGHVYASDYDQAVMYWAGGAGTMGAAWHVHLQNGSRGALVSGAGVLLVMWIHSVATADDAVRRYNESIRVGTADEGVGVSMRF